MNKRIIKKPPYVHYWAVMSNFFVKYANVAVAWGTFIGVILAVIGLAFTYTQLRITNTQLEQTNFHTKWQNYNKLNLRYSKLYESMPVEVANDTGKDFSVLKHEAKRWVRQYFNLYSEEYWLYQKKLIPEEMWSKRINNGVKVNLDAYPVMIKGYYYWENKGSFNHPDGFRDKVKKVIKELEQKDR